MIGLIFIGTAFMLIAGIGLLRMPDVYMRMSATTKAATLGVGLILVAAAVHFQDIAVTSKVIATIVFLLLTSPVAAHMIGRAAYFDGVPLWDQSVADELKGKYDMTTHELASPPKPNPKKQKAKPTPKKQQKR
jgi:multicomponent Na+:H+ antiporter subunit G